MRIHSLRRRTSRPVAGLLAVLALVLLQAGAVADAQELEHLMLQGREALRAGDAAGASEAFRQVLVARPDDREALLDYGRSRSALQDWQGAADSYMRLIELEPGHAKALNNLANVYFRQGRYDDAARWYRRAVDVDPDYLLAQFHLGWVLRQLNRVEASREAFSACIDLPAHNDRERMKQLDCHFYLGTFAYRDGAPEAAARVMEQVLSVHPYHAEARHYLAMAYRRLGRQEEARQQFEIHRQILRAQRSDPIEAPHEEP